MSVDVCCVLCIRCDVCGKEYRDPFHGPGNQANNINNNKKTKTKTKKSQKRTDPG